MKKEICIRADLVVSDAISNLPSRFSTPILSLPSVTNLFFYPLQRRLDADSRVFDEAGSAFAARNFLRPRGGRRCHVDHAPEFPLRLRPRRSRIQPPISVSAARIRLRGHRIRRHVAGAVAGVAPAAVPVESVADVDGAGRRRGRDRPPLDARRFPFTGLPRRREGVGRSLRIRLSRRPHEFVGARADCFGDSGYSFTWVNHLMSSV